MRIVLVAIREAIWLVRWLFLHRVRDCQWERRVGLVVSRIFAVWIMINWRENSVSILFFVWSCRCGYKYSTEYLATVGHVDSKKATHRMAKSSLSRDREAICSLQETPCSGSSCATHSSAFVTVPDDGACSVSRETLSVLLEQPQRLTVFLFYIILERHIIYPSSFKKIDLLHTTVPQELLRKTSRTYSWSERSLT